MATTSARFSHHPYCEHVVDREPLMEAVPSATEDIVPLSMPSVTKASVDPRPSPIGRTQSEPAAFKVKQRGVPRVTHILEALNPDCQSTY